MSLKGYYLNESFLSSVLYNLCRLSCYTLSRMTQACLVQETACFDRGIRMVFSDRGRLSCGIHGGWLTIFFSFDEQPLSSAPHIHMTINYSKRLVHYIKREHTSAFVSVKQATASELCGLREDGHALGQKSFTSHHTINNQFLCWLYWYFFISNSSNSNVGFKYYCKMSHS